jgi:hypothetical protein
MSTDPAIEKWMDALTPGRREQVEELSSLVRAARPDVDEAIKWNRLTFTTERNWHHWLYAVAVTRSAVSLVFHKGTLLDDPEGLLRGTARYARQIPYAQAVKRPGGVIALCAQAVTRQTDLIAGT